MVSFKLIRKNQADELMSRILNDIREQKKVVKKHMTNKDRRTIKKNYQLSGMMFKGCLCSMVRYLNDQEILNPDGFSFKISSEYFSKDSKPAEIYTHTFKVRFLTLLYVYILNNLQDIIDFEMELHKKESLADEYETLYQVMDHVENFTVNFINGTNKKSDVKYIYEMISIGKINTMKPVLKTVTKQINYIQASQIKIPAFKFLEMPMKEDEIIHNASKIAYIIATNKMDIQRTGNYKKGLTFNSKDDLVDIYEKLGKVINQAHKNFGVPVMWGLFFEANPDISKTSFSSISNKDIETGIKAMILLKFVCGSKEVENVISRML